jgi:DNA polymerase-1
MPTLTLIDASGFVYRAYHALPPLTTTSGLVTNAVYGFTTMVLKALREHAPTHVALVFDAGRRSFRNDIDPQYKANRPEAPPDLARQFPLVRDVARALAVPVLEEVGIEADDIIGTLATRAREKGWDVVIVTGDKDFAQLVDDHVELYDPMAEASGRGGRTHAAEVVEKLGVTPAQVVDYMALLGDKVDNVPGIPGVGEVTAAALIQKFGSVEAMLARPEEIPAAVKRGGEALKQKLVANADRIRMNRRLVELKKDVALPAGPEDFARRTADPEVVRKLFTELEFGRLLKDLPAAAPSPAAAKEELLFDRGALDAAVKHCQEAGQVGLRAVRAGDNDRTAPLAGVAFAAKGRAFYLPLSHRYLGAPRQLSRDEVFAALRPLLEDAAVPKHGHDLKADLHGLAQLGIDLAPVGVDAELASTLLLPTRREHPLPDVARERIAAELPRVEEVLGTGKKAQPADTVEVERVGRWAAAEADAVARLAAPLTQALLDEGLTRVYEDIEKPLLPILMRMERVGVLVDSGAMGRMSEEFGRTMKSLEERIFVLAKHPFNVGSTRELATVLFEELGLPVSKRGKTGPSTDSEVLEKLAEQHELPRLILEHRSLAKLKGTYVDALPLLVDPRDGRIHTTFHQGGAATGRIASHDPNLQNIPIRTELSRRIRGAFVAPPGQQILSADYSQIELRILAHYAEDPALLESFEKGEDVHTRTAAETFGVEREAVSSDQRRIAKVLNFGIAYGLSAFGLAQRLDMDKAEAGKIIERYFTRYAAVKRWLDATVEQARKDGFVTTLFGRKRAMPDIASRVPAMRQAAERTAVNTPIQGTAADVIKIAMIRVDAALRSAGLDARMLLQVHDELVFEVAERDVPALSSLVSREMEGAASLRCRLTVETGAGPTWAEAH